MAEIIASAEGVRKEYFRKGRESARTFDAVSDVSLTLEQGKLVALAGRSGSGKSTLLNMVGGLVRPTEGSIMFMGKDLYALSDAELSRLRNASIGVVPQGQSALHSLNVVDNVKLPYLMYRADDGIDDRAMRLLSQFDIADLSECHPSELSGGELRRVAIARALVCNPKLVLADEPTADLDDENTKSVLKSLRDYADEGAAVLIVTHEQSALEYADIVLRMDAGKLVL